MEVYIVEWEQYDGWPSPDGYSIHTSEAKMKAYKNTYGYPLFYKGVLVDSSMPLSTEILENDLLYARAKRAGGTLHVERRIW